jgi:hypothetical protein
MTEAASGAVPPQTHTLPIGDRVAQGRALRERLPRSGQATWQASAKRRDPVEILIEQGKSPVANLPLRYSDEGLALRACAAARP